MHSRKLNLTAMYRMYSRVELRILLCHEQPEPEAQLSQTDRAMLRVIEYFALLRVIEYFAKSFKVSQGHSK